MIPWTYWPYLLTAAALGMGCVAWLWDAAKRIDGLEAEVHRWKENTDKERTRRYKIQDRAQRAAQAIVEELGAMGPEGVDETAQRACVVLVARKERVVELDVSQQEVADLQNVVAGLKGAQDQL